MRTYWQVHCARAIYAFAARQRGQPPGIDVVPRPPTMSAIDVEPDSMFPQRLPHIVGDLQTPAVLACFSRGTNIANWDAAVYCAWVVRVSLVVGEIKRWLRNHAGSIDLGADTAFLVRP
jgi:hypothetical protein